MFIDSVQRKTLTGDRVIIYGAGRGGEILLREILNNKKIHKQPVGFIDDDPLKTGKKIQGYPIFGTFRHLDGIVRKHHIDGLLLSIAENDPKLLERVRAFCQGQQLFLQQFSVGLKDVELKNERRLALDHTDEQ